MTFEPKSYDHLIGTSGFSDQLLKNHFTLYQGYVKNVNTLVQELALLTNDGKSASPSYAELKRRFGWEFNGMRLHELYFGNMAASSSPMSGATPLTKGMTEAYGTYENWEKDFRAIAAMRGIGWAVLYFDSTSHQLFNVWVNEHDMGHLAGCIPVLVLDVFEHAYTLDYGIKKADYIEAFFHAIDWKEVERRSLEGVKGLQ